MQKITVVGNSVTLVSDLNFEDIKKLNNFRPEALVLVDENTEEEYFRIGVNECEASVSEYGITFDNKTPTGKACVTMLSPVFEDEEDKENYLKENLFDITINLKKIEKQATTALKTLDKEMTAFKAQINTIDLDGNATADTESAE